jgi:hypothetical protein
LEIRVSTGFPQVQLFRRRRPFQPLELNSEG